MEKFLIAFLLCCISFQAIHGRKIKENSLPPTVFGSVWCNSCLKESYSGSGIPNVAVTIECGEFQATNITSNFGLYQFEIPAEVASSSAKLSACKVKVVNEFSKVEGELGTCTNPVETSQSASVPTLVYGSFFGVGPFVFQPAKALSSCKHEFQAPPEANEPEAMPPQFIHPAPPAEEANEPEAMPPQSSHPAPPAEETPSTPFVHHAQEKPSSPPFVHHAPPEEEKPSSPPFVHPAPAPEEEKTSPPPLIHPSPPVQEENPNPPLPFHCSSLRGHPNPCYDTFKYPPFPAPESFPPPVVHHYNPAPEKPPTYFYSYPPVEYP